MASSSLPLDHPALYQSEVDATQTSLQRTVLVAVERVFTNVEVLETVGQLFQQADVDCLDEVVRDVEIT